jgi:tRNA (cytidine/uridine-2'-O-)-methyltransferase
MTFELEVPAAPIHVALVEPRIPQNTGTLARLCASQRVPLHIVGRPAFRLDDRSLRRAGLDYWSEVQLIRHRTLHDLQRGLERAQPPLIPRLIFFETVGTRAYHQFLFRPGDCLVFGPETVGLSPDLLRGHEERIVSIPMGNPAVRSLNLAVSAAMGLGEALRQVGQPPWQANPGILMGKITPVE